MPRTTNLRVSSSLSFYLTSLLNHSCAPKRIFKKNWSCWLQTSNTIHWLPVKQRIVLSSSRCASKPHRTSRTTASLSLTPDGAVFARLTPMPSLFHESILGTEAVFWWRVRKYGTVFPLHCDSLTLNSGSSNDFQRHFCLARLQHTSDVLLLMRCV